MYIFWGVIDPKFYLDDKNECFLETYKFGEDCMTHQNLSNSEQKFWGKGSKLINFSKSFSKNHNFVKGHAILNRLIGLVNKTLYMDFLSRNLKFSFKLGFGSMMPKKLT